MPCRLVTISGILCRVDWLLFLEYYAVSTGNYLATSSSPRKALLVVLDPEELGTRLFRNVDICPSTRRFSER